MSLGRGRSLMISCLMLEADFFCKLCDQCVAVINNERLQCCIVGDEDYGGLVALPQVQQFILQFKSQVNV